MSRVTEPPEATGTHPYLHVMRYMGAKRALLPFLIPTIEGLCRPGDLVVDLLAGTHAVGYALKGRQRLLANDVQTYSLWIGRALLAVRPPAGCLAMAREQILPLARDPQRPSVWRYFSDTYADTYFSAAQCEAVDGIRHAIEAVHGPGDALPPEAPEAPDALAHKAAHLTALIYAMCYAQSTPGHFAQFLAPQHPRAAYLRGLDMAAAFLGKCEELEGMVPGRHSAAVTCLDYRELLSQPGPHGLDEARVVYVDPPYSAEQYSRFYHLLETAVLYDAPAVAHHARYREGRFASGFSVRTRTRDEFRHLFRALSTACPRAAVLVSYGSAGVVPIDELLALARERYPRVEMAERPHAHSTQGKGAQRVTEYLLTLLP